MAAPSIVILKAESLDEVAPHALHIDLAETTCVGIAKPRSELKFDIDFGDPTGRTFRNLPSENGNFVHGYQGKHVYELPGIYTITTKSAQVNGESSILQTTITVEAFSGTTYYLHPSHPSASDSNPGTNPSAPLATFGTLMTKMVGNNKRGLIYHGSDITVTTSYTITTTGPWILGAYGDLTPLAAVRRTGGGIFETGGADHATFMDLNFVGTAGTCFVGVGQHMLILRCTGTGFQHFVNNGSGNPKDGFTMSDGTTNSIQQYGLYFDSDPAQRHNRWLGVLAWNFNDNTNSNTLCRLFCERYVLQWCDFDDPLDDNSPPLRLVSHNPSFPQEAGIVYHCTFNPRNIAGPNYIANYIQIGEGSGALQRSAKDIVIDGCRFKATQDDNQMYAIELRAGDNAGSYINDFTCRFCIFDGPNQAVRTSSKDKDGIYLYGNLHYNQISPNVNIAFLAEAGTVTPMLNVVLRNNILDYIAPAGAQTRYIVNCPGAIGDLAAITETNNIIYLPSAPSNQRARAAGTIYTIIPGSPPTGTWITAGKGANSLTAQPLYVSAGTGDFHPAATSPAVNAGYAQPGAYFDFDGLELPIGQALDIGPFGRSLTLTVVVVGQTISGLTGTVIATGIEYSGVTYQSRLIKLFAVGDGGEIQRMDLDGANKTQWVIGGDLEDICVADPGTDFVYIGIEHLDSIKEFNIVTGVVTRIFDLTAYMQSVDNNQGLEALTFVPDAADPEGGTFIAGLQENGKGYRFRLPIKSSPSSTSVTFIETFDIVAGRTNLNALHWDRDENALYGLWKGVHKLRAMRADRTLIHEWDSPGGISEEGGVEIGPDLYLTNDTGVGASSQLRRYQNWRRGTTTPRGGRYARGAVVPLNFVADQNWRVKVVTGTDDDTSKASTNAVTMTDSKIVTVEYEPAGTAAKATDYRRRRV